MVLFNYSTRELTAKVVYYGPGLCGKTTNLQYIHSTLPDNVKGKMLSLATKTDRTLFFDFLPIDLGQIRGMKTRVQLYTVPGQVFYNETRKLVLKGADGIVFVADSQATMLGANVESFKNLDENLKAHGMKLAEMPHVLQFNKRDLPKLSSIEELNAAINKFNAPFYESVATTGIGVQDTLKAVTKLVLLHLTKKYDPKATAAAQMQPAKAAATAVAAGSPAAQVRQPDMTSPARTMQMPVVPPQSGGNPADGIPLSAAPMSEIAPAAPVHASVPTPTGGPGGLPQPGEASFADDEIQDLVDEVQESSMGAEMPFERQVPASQAQAAIDLGVAEPLVPTDSFDPTTSLDASPGPLPTQPVEEPTAAPGTPAVSGRARQQTGPAASLDFEIDHRVDPEWGAATPPGERQAQPFPDPAATSDPPPIAAATDTDTDDAWDLGPVDDTPLETSEPSMPFPPAEPSPEVDRPAGDELPTLTDVVEDQQIFDAAGSDVARMKAGEEREIVVPLEIDEPGKDLQRFKLSIHLRLDPVD